MSPGIPNLVSKIPLEKFVDPDLKQVLATKLVAASNNISGKQLFHRFGEIRKEVRSKYVNHLPGGLSEIPSGKSLCDAYDDFVFKQYIEDNKTISNVPKDDISMPFGYEYKSEKTVYLLVSKGFRTSKHLVEDVSVLSPGETRVNLRRKKVL